MSAGWSPEEVRLIVEDHLFMLEAQLRKEDYNKSQHRRRLMEQLPARSGAAIERQHQNISAVLQRLNLPTLRGYRPLGHYQQFLSDMVEAMIPQWLSTWSEESNEMTGSEENKYWIELRGLVYTSDLDHTDWDHACELLERCPDELREPVQEYIGLLDNWPVEIRGAQFKSDISHDGEPEEGQRPWHEELWWPYLMVLELAFVPPQLHPEANYTHIRRVILYDSSNIDIERLLREITRRMHALERIESAVLDRERTVSRLGPGWTWVFIQEEGRQWLIRSTTAIQSWIESIDEAANGSSIQGDRRWHDGRTLQKVGWFFQPQPSVYTEPEAAALSFVKEVLSSPEAILFAKLSPLYEWTLVVALKRQDHFVLVEMSTQGDTVLPAVRKLQVLRTDSALNRSCFVRVGVLGELWEASNDR